ncbi:MAG: tyrosine-protein phosphatase, partial [Proteobacteria bacterium]|nr:tyrosine-protein phosphatase [Pseudomonadota bacterium]
FHCTAGKDRTGIVSMALLKSYGVSDEEIIKDYMRTNRNVLWPTIKKCIGIRIYIRSKRLDLVRCSRIPISNIQK